MTVELKCIQKSYCDRIVLNIEDIRFESGKIYAILGPNGSGKTTLLRILAATDKQDNSSILYSSILYDGKAVPAPGTISYLPQKPYMFDMTVLENVLLGLKNVQMELGNRKDAEKRAMQAIKSVGMSDFINANARKISGGEAQRTAVARTLILGRKLVLLDEPASSADISSMRLVEEYISSVNKRDKSTIIFSTHNPSQALRIADEAVIMWEGRILEEGKPSNLFNFPKCQETKDFLQNWRI